MTSDNRLTTHDSIIHRAGWVVIDPWTVFRDGFVKVKSGLIKEIGRGRITDRGHILDHGPGILMPVLVNSHTHLELSALKGKMPFGQGFGLWVKALIKQRDALSSETLCSGAEKGLRAMMKSGCGMAGDISTLGFTGSVFSNSGLAGVWFREILGDSLDKMPTCGDKKGETVMSLAGHAPHTTSPKLLQYLKNEARKKKLPFSIHLAESEDEVRFFKTGKGPWADFLSEREIDFSQWRLPQKSPVQYLDSLGILDKNTIAVHLIHADQTDLEILLKRDVSVCLCPRSNHNIHHRLPDLGGILAAGISPCLGTDSLASVESLSLFDEMAYASRVFPLVPPEKILAMATINGARALGGIDRFGSLMPGKKADFIYVPVGVAGRSVLLETLVNADFDANRIQRI